MSVKSRIMYIHLLVPMLTAISASDVTTPQGTDAVITKLDPVQFIQIYDDEGNPYLLNTWLTSADLEEVFAITNKYDPDTQNQYLLHTRNNSARGPDTIVLGDSAALNASDFSPNRPTYLIVPGWRNTPESEIAKVLVPACLQARDANVFFLNWTAGSLTLNYVAACNNTVASGKSAACFLDWLSLQTGTDESQYVVMGHSLGGQQGGVISRNTEEKLNLMIMDPAFPLWYDNSQRVTASDGLFSRAVHTNCYEFGYPTPVALQDFYCNNGIMMPGCVTPKDSHDRAYMYIAESIISGGFTGVECSSYTDAFPQTCNGDATLQMGGLDPDTSKTGVYSISTNAESPYSKG